MISYGQNRENIFCLFSWLGWSLHGLESTPKEEALRAIGERAEAVGRGLPAYAVRFQTKQQAVCLSRLWKDGCRVGKEGKRLGSLWARGEASRI